MKGIFYFIGRSRIVPTDACHGMFGRTTVRSFIFHHVFNAQHRFNATFPQLLKCFSANTADRDMGFGKKSGVNIPQKTL